MKINGVERIPIDAAWRAVVPGLCKTCTHLARAKCDSIEVSLTLNRSKPEINSCNGYEPETMTIEQYKNTAEYKERYHV